MKSKTIAIVLCLCLTLILFQSFFEPIGSEAETTARTLSRNMAGDEDTLPENQTFLDLKGGAISTISTGLTHKEQAYQKGDTIVAGRFETDAVVSGDIDKMFDGTNLDCYIHNGFPIQFSFLFPINITMLRVYPLGNLGMKPNTIEVHRGLNSGYDWRMTLVDTTSINNPSDYIEIHYSNVITSNIIIEVDSLYSVNEIEIYYNPDLTPYWYNPVVNTSYYNITNTTYHDHYNITYDNTTYVNHTHLNTTEQFVTYENTTEQSVTYQNNTYLNLTNETGVTYENFTDQYFPVEYHNTTADLSELESRLDNLSNELDDTRDAAERAEKSAKQKPIGLLNYLNLVLLIVLIIIGIMLLLRKPKPGAPSGSPTPDIEHVPTVGKFSHEEKAVIRSEAPLAPVTMKQQPVQPVKPTTPPLRQLTSGEPEGWDVGK